MSLTPAPRRRPRLALAAAGSLVALAAVAGAAVASSTGSGSQAAGQPPPEVAPATDSWPAHDYDLSNSQATTHTRISAATVANDVVFTSDFTGKIYAFSTTTGKQLWTAQAPAGINAFPAVTDHMLLVGAGTPGLGTNPKPVYSLVAYALS